MKYIKGIQQEIMSCGIVIKDKKVLLMRRSDIGVWEIPGGGIEFGEDPEQAMMREIREETGMKIKSKGILCIISVNFSVKNKNIKKQIIHLAYLCEHISGQLLVNDEHIGFRWVNYEKGMKIGFENKIDKNGKLNRLAFGTDRILRILKNKKLID